MIKQVTDASFAGEVLESQRGVVVKFGAAWCGPCRRLAPVFEELATELPGLKFVAVDIDQAPVVSGRHRIMSVPTLMVFQGGEPIKVLGANTLAKDSLRSALSQCL